MRYAILCAVSTEAQATQDKISLPHQEKKCREIALAKTWVETAGPYIIPGKSRTSWVNLKDAEDDIPALHEMLEDGRAGLFDVLMLYDYNRLRDLLAAVAKTLSAYNVQIYSVNQPIEPMPVEQFDAYASDAEPMVRGMSQIISQWNINDLRRKYKAGMPARILRGLNPLRVPFGYRWVGKKEPPVIDASKATLVIEMKDLLMAGRSVIEIARHADASGILPPNKGETRKGDPDRVRKWDPSSVRYILSNPFYAGIVTLQKSMSIRDPRRKNQRRQVDQPRSKWNQGKGKHEALWDESTHRAILRELDRRYESTRNYAARFPFSGLLVCGVCAQKLHRRNNGSTKAGRRRVLSCAVGESHVNLDYTEGVEMISRELERQLSEKRGAPVQSPAVPPVDDQAQVQTGILLADLQRRRKQIQEDRQVGIYTQVEALEQINSVDDQIARLEQKQEQARESVLVREEFKELLGTRLEHFAEWVMEDDPQLVHRLLHALCEKIIVHPDRRIEIAWRTA